MRTTINFGFSIGDCVYAIYDTFFATDAKVSNGIVLHKWEFLALTTVISVGFYKDKYSEKVTYGLADGFDASSGEVECHTQPGVLEIFRTVDEAQAAIALRNQSLKFTAISFKG